MKTKKQAGFAAIEALIIILALIIIGFAGWYVYQHRHKGVQTNRWIGTTSNYNWSDTSNWSLGTPKNGQNLQINVSKIKGYKQTEATLNDNIPHLSVHSIIFKTPSFAADLVVDGDTLTITNGITELANYKTADFASDPSVTLDNDIIFKGNQTVSIEPGAKESPSLSIGLIGDTSINISNYTIRFDTPANSTAGVDINAHVIGNGNLVLNGGSPIFGNGSSNYANPNFTGMVHILKGTIASVLGNDGFGTAAITVDNGGTLEVGGAGTTTFNLANPLTISGNGMPETGASTGKGTGASLGAITACITPAQEGCGVAQHVTLSGQITLLGNTALGEVPSCGPNGECQLPDPNVTTYTIAKPIHGNYNLTTVPDSNTKIIIDK